MLIFVMFFLLGTVKCKQTNANEYCRGFSKKILHIAHCAHSSAGGRSENRGGGTKKGLLFTVAIR